ncbi:MULTISPECIES: phosphatase PAP2 family protein [unclassified Streptomyces]|uniref:phosphatase PAP2 family protein n=1 Tax=unclassified Streptomyces TaxID=2593676 RepID=UPI001F2D6AF1|nr:MULTISPECIES: phosphatase PAP2 family protein [unclassified Streptomyces]MCF0091002.1 Undecaprenyl-diphosphatase BcrC [Streptomyces sp. MH192]MCF0103485.1 Undecaprenyl-diphosphatase BcrC [Streptomyces sp. MH191]
MHPPHADAPPEAPTSPGAGARRGAALCAALAAPAVLLTALVASSWGPLLSADAGLARAAHRGAVGHAGLTHACRILTDWVWDPVTMRLLCAAAVVWLVWRRSDRPFALWVAVTCALGTLLQQALKALVGRPRPVWPDPVDSAHYAAYPSGHALTATVVCGLLLWLLRRYGAGRVLWRSAVTAALVSVTGVGLTRIWLGVHWPSDVLGGWLLGLLLVALAVVTYERRYGGTPARPPARRP